MLCKNCGCDTYTVETRERKDAYVRRRKVCEMCGEKFTTFEFTDDVVKEVIELLEGRLSDEQLRERLEAQHLVQPVAPRATSGPAPKRK